MKKKTNLKNIFEKHSKTFMGLFIIVIFLSSTLAYISNSIPTKTIDDKVVTTKDNKIYIHLDDYYIDMQYYPSQIQELYGKKIDYPKEDYDLAYYMPSNNQVKEISFVKKLRDSQAKFSILGQKVTLGCLGNCSYTKINCNNNHTMIVIKEANINKYYKKDNCQFFETTNVNKTIDYLIYKSAKIIE